MALRTHNLDSRLAALDKDLATLRGDLSGPVAIAIDRWRGDAAALRFHLRDAADHPPLIAILGGTGTGKSTLVNRLLRRQSLRHQLPPHVHRRRRRDHCRIAKNLPQDWLGIEHRLAADDELPARGQVDSLLVVTTPQQLAAQVTLIDTPDLDGDQPQHHVQADRAFRWATRCCFWSRPRNIR